MLRLIVLLVALSWSAAAEPLYPGAAREYDRGPNESQSAFNDRKEAHCRGNPSALIGLRRNDVRVHCGPWVRQNRYVSAGTELEQLMWYGGYLYVYLRNGVVVHLQAR